MKHDRKGRDAVDRGGLCTITSPASEAQARRHSIGPRHTSAAFSLCTRLRLDTIDEIVLFNFDTDVTTSPPHLADLHATSCIELGIP